MLIFLQCVCTFGLAKHLLSHKLWGQLFQMLYLEHWMPSECGEKSRQTAHPTLRWWQRQYAAGRWCQAAGFPGDAVFSLQVALPVRLHSQHWCDRTSGRQRLGHDSACLEGAAKTPGCPLDCGWSGWAQGRGGELWIDKTGRLRPKEVVWAKENNALNSCSFLNFVYVKKE